MCLQKSSEVLRSPQAVAGISEMGPNLYKTLLFCMLEHSQKISGALRSSKKFSGLLRLLRYTPKPLWNLAILHAQGFRRDSWSGLGVSGYRLEFPGCSWDYFIWALGFSWIFPGREPKRHPKKSKRHKNSSNCIQAIPNGVQDIPNRSRKNQNLPKPL